MKDQILVHSIFFNKGDVEFDLRTSGVNKPRKALWTSEIMDDLKESGWIKWSIMERFPLKDFIYRIHPREEVNVLEVNSPEDVDKIPTLHLGYTKVFDYRWLAEVGYDGIHFTLGAAALGHCFEYSKMMLLNSVDCESTCWFNVDWIDYVDPIGYTEKVLEIE